MKDAFASVTGSPAGFEILDIAFQKLCAFGHPFAETVAQIIENSHLITVCEK